MDAIDTPLPLSDRKYHPKQDKAQVPSASEMCDMFSCFWLDLQADEHSSYLTYAGHFGLRFDCVEY